MRDHLEPNDKINEIKLLFTHPSYNGKVIILVEGKSDLNLYRSLVHNPNIKIDTADGKKPLLTIMEQLSIEIPNKVFGICDADCDHLENLADIRNEHSVYLTDYHDAEMMMLNSPSLQSFINEYSNAENIEDLRASLFSNVIEVSYDIGIFRWFNISNHLNINFVGLKYEEFVEVNELKIDFDPNKFIEAIIEKSKNLKEGTTNSYLNEMFNEYKAKEACQFQVASGHDTTKIIALLYRQAWATNDRNINFKHIERSLRIGYQITHFRNTQLYKNLSLSLNNLGINFT